MNPDPNHRLVPVHALCRGAVQAVVWLPLPEAKGTSPPGHCRVSLHRVGRRLNQGVLLKPGELAEAIQALHEADDLLSQVQRAGWRSTSMFVAASDLLPVEAPP